MRKKSLRKKKKLHQKLHHHIINNPVLSISLLILLILGGFIATQVFAAKPVQPTGQFEAISVNTNDEISNQGTNDPFHMTKDARFFVFESYSSNLDPNDTNNAPDLFLRDRVNGTTELVSILPDGTQPTNGVGRGYVSADGRYISFADSSNIYLRDRQTQTTSVMLAISNRGLHYMTPDTRYFVFRNPKAGRIDQFNLYLYDSQTNNTEQLSVSSTGEQASGDVQGGMLSDDGRYAVFSTRAPLTSDDTNSNFDAYLRDRVTGTTSFVSYGIENAIPNDQSGDAYINADGRYIVFWSLATNLVPDDTNGQQDIFLVDRQNSTIEKISLTDREQETLDLSTFAKVTDDGRYVVFNSQSTNLNPYKTTYLTTYIRDRLNSTTELITQNPFCKTALFSASDIYVSNDGRYVTFFTGDSAISIDNNELGDIYLRDRSIPFGRLPKHCK